MTHNIYTNWPDTEFVQEAAAQIPCAEIVQLAVGQFLKAVSDWTIMSAHTKDQLIEPPATGLFAEHEPRS